MTGHIQTMQNGQITHRITPFPGETLNKSRAQPELTLALKLANQLQTTLELESVIELFVEEIKQSFPHDNASYQDPSKSFSITFGEQTRHRASYTLKVLEQNLGEIHFSRKSRFSEAEIEGLEDLLAVLLYPLRNALLYRDAIQSSLLDALTGVKNRAAFESNYSREIEISRRKSSELSLLVLDIDHFKRVNDRFGHMVGDLALKNVAQAVEATIRCSDALYRYGGEEFVVVLNGTDKAGAELLAERIRQNIEALVFTSPKGLCLTLSVGVATLSKDDSTKSLFERADNALYQAKESGRNRAVIAD